MSSSSHAENLRQAGLNRNGRVRMGRPTKAAPGSVPFSSIPTKYKATERPRYGSLDLSKRREGDACGTGRPSPASAAGFLSHRSPLEAAPLCAWTTADTATEAPMTTPGSYNPDARPHVPSIW